MYLKTMTWLDVERYLKTSNTILIPIGSYEQHGPTGHIGTDIICPEAIAEAVSKQINMLIGPSLSIGMAQHHLGFAGTISLKPTTMIAMICDVVNSLKVHGFKNYMFLNGHGGNIPIIHSAFAQIWSHDSYNENRNYQPIDMQLHCWWRGPRVTQLIKQLYGEAEGMHATASEVALSYFAYPDQQKNEVLSPTIAPIGDIKDSRNYRQQYPDGRIGSNPALASVEHGQQFCTAAKEDMIEKLQQLEFI